MKILRQTFEVSVEGTTTEDVLRKLKAFQDALTRARKESGIPSVVYHPPKEKEL